MDRRRFLQGAALLGAGALVGGRPVFASRSVAGGPYGALQPVNSDGLQLPTGFRSRLLAVSGQTVPGTKYTWHFSPDGGACMARPGGGWVYISNGEPSNGGGGVGVIAFDATGKIVDGYSILHGTNRSCSGGVTPWGTYLSGEENGAAGRVFECDPLQAGQGVHRPALGAFGHEMSVVDPRSGAIYLMEDHEVGRLYRFLPTTPGDLTAGQLYAASVTNGRVKWVPVSATAPERSATTTPFGGGEGICLLNGSLYYTTKLDVKVWRLELATRQLSVFYDHAATPTASLDAVDNVAAHVGSGDLFVCEDGGNLELGLLTTVGERTVSPFLRFVGHDQSEVTGVAFSPAGDRLYVSSQRGTDGVTGRTYEISGPFRHLPRRRLPQPRGPWR